MWLTWLRRPLARTVSEYLHAKANLVVWDYAMPATFLEFVTSREYAVGAQNMAQNRMVRMLGGGAQPLADDMEGQVASSKAKAQETMAAILCGSRDQILHPVGRSPVVMLQQSQAAATSHHEDLPHRLLPSRERELAGHRHPSHVGVGHEDH